jgi:CDP-ribitol ribitolphosphotransferase
MHRNYTAIIAGGEGIRPVFAEAFSCPMDKVAAVGLPRMDYLLGEQTAAKRKNAGAAILAKYPQLASGRTNILFAPTFRKKADKANSERQLQDLMNRLPAQTSNCIISLHPLSGLTHSVAVQRDSFSASVGAAAPAGAATSSSAQTPILHIPGIKGIDLLEIADYVITDYSAIAFEAALLRKKVLFYVPDIAEYRLSPGLNIDLEELFPLITFKDAPSLVEYLQQDARLDDRQDSQRDDRHDSRSNSHYAASGFWQFCDSYLAQPATGVTERLASYLAEMIH